MLEKHSQTTKKDSQIAEVTFSLKGGAVIHVKERDEDIYSAIDILGHRVSQKLQRHKERTQQRNSRSTTSDDNISMSNEAIDFIETEFDESGPEVCV